MSGGRGRHVGHPAVSWSLQQHGVGAPGPAGPSPRPGPSSSGRFQGPSNPLDQVGAAFQQAVGLILAPGEVLIGVALIVVGLLLATGQMGKLARGAGRAGLFAASRGVIR